jgi:RNA-directed DNA polymerase
MKTRKNGMTDSHMHNPDRDSTEKTRRMDSTSVLNDTIMERILARENVTRAWRQVRRNHGAPGVDGMTIEGFPTYARAHWQEIRAALLGGRYRPSAVRRVEIPKPSGGRRKLGIPTVIDRVIQQAIAQILTPIFDPEFSESSFGFRPKRSAHDAVKKVREHISDGSSTAIEVDLEKYFDTVNHDVLMERVARKVRDKRVLKLIGSYLRAGVLVDGVREQTREGVPQGGPLSPLLANILLDDFDKELEKRGHRFARYADDFVILVKSPRAGERVKASVARFLERKLKLKVNSAKSKAGKANQAQFLGFTFPGKTIRWTVDSLDEFKHRIRKLTGRSNGISMEKRVAELNRYIQGWMNYFVLSKYWTPIPELDAWMRRRIRCCHWKQWRHCRTRVREMHARGVNRSCAWQLALSGHGPWYYSDHSALAQALTNSYIHKELGLVSLRDHWCRFHYPS